MLTQPIRSVLVATDLGEGSDAVVRGAAMLAAATAATLHIVHAFELEQAQEEVEPGAPSPGFPGRIAMAEKAVEEQLRRAVPEVATLGSRQVIVFLADKAILARADEVAADVIVLGPHQARLGDCLLGTTADRVVHAAPVPVLIVGDGLSSEVRNVLVPVDLSDPAHPALDRAVRWTAELGASGVRARLHVLYVIPSLHDVADFTLTDEQWISDELHRAVENAFSPAGDTAGPPVVRALRSGDEPAEEILRYARDTEADLLVLPTHARGAIERVLLGSVASAVARRAPCPVLLIPPAVWQTDEAPSEQRAADDDPALHEVPEPYAR